MSHHQAYLRCGKADNTDPLLLNHPEGLFGFESLQTNALGTYERCGIIRGNVRTARNRRKGTNVILLSYFHSFCPDFGEGEVGLDGMLEKLGEAGGAGGMGNDRVLRRRKLCLLQIVHISQRLQRGNLCGHIHIIGRLDLHEVLGNPGREDSIAYSQASQPSPLAEGAQNHQVIIFGS